MQTWLPRNTTKTWLRLKQSKRRTGRRSERGESSRTIGIGIEAPPTTTINAAVATIIDKELVAVTVIVMVATIIGTTMVASNREAMAKEIKNKAAVDAITIETIGKITKTAISSHSTRRRGT